MFDLYKLSYPIQPEYEDVETAHVKYLYDIAIDRVNDCQIDGRDFVLSPRIFDRHYTNSSTQTVSVITIDESDKFAQGSMLSYDSDYWLCLSCFSYHNQYLKGRTIKARLSRDGLFHRMRRLIIQVSRAIKHCSMVQIR